MDMEARRRKISIVVPCLNERDSLPLFLAELARVTQDLKSTTPPQNLR